MNIAVILSGGTGLDVSKQYIEVDSRPMIYLQIDLNDMYPSVDAIIVTPEAE